MTHSKTYKPTHGGRIIAEQASAKQVRHCFELFGCSEAVYVDDKLEIESDSLYACELATICERIGRPVSVTKIEFEADQQDYAFEWPSTFTELVSRYGQWFGV